MFKRKFAKARHKENKEPKNINFVRQAACLPKKK